MRFQEYDYEEPELPGITTSTAYYVAIPDVELTTQSSSVYDGDFEEGFQTTQKIMSESDLWLVKRRIESEFTSFDYD